MNFAWKIFHVSNRVSLLIKVSVPDYYFRYVLIHSPTPNARLIINFIYLFLSLRMRHVYDRKFLKCLNFHKLQGICKPGWERHNSQ